MTTFVEALKNLVKAYKTIVPHELLDWLVAVDAAYACHHAEQREEAAERARQDLCIVKTDLVPSVV